MDELISKQTNKQKYTLRPKQRAFIAALKTSLGVVSEASRIANIPRVTHYLWMRENPLYAQEVKEIDDYAIEFVESKMFNHIELGGKESIPLIMFYLRTRARKKGYADKMADINIIEKQQNMNITIEYPTGLKEFIEQENAKLQVQTDS